MTTKVEPEGNGVGVDKEGSGVHKSAAARGVPVVSGAHEPVFQEGSASAGANVPGKQSDDLFRLLVNGVKDYAIYMLDSAGNVTSWNAGAAYINGYNSEEVLGKNFSVFYERADVENGRPQEALLTAARTGHSEEEGWRVRKDGSKFWASGVLSPIHDSSGALLGFAKITRDLTERRKLEEQLNQAQKLEATGRLAAGVAHDFNNVLSVVLSYSELLALGLKAGDPMLEDLQQIRVAGLRAAALTTQLLAFSRQQALQPQVVDLTAVIGTMEKMLRSLIGEDVMLTTICSPSLGKVLVDPGQIEQVIMNLVVNARDAMPSGGTLTIETSEVELDDKYASDHVGAKVGRHVLLSVNDTGTGMDHETKARLFEPFFTTKEPGKGTGLGLSTVFGIVRQSGGTIQVISEPQKGASFKVYLPITDQAAAVVQVSPPLSVRVPQGSETILLVEDDEAVRVLARTILRKYGYNVLDAQGGGDALLLCEQYTAPIHLLLTDVLMPRMSGRRLAERLLLVRPDMKVLYMSGYPDDAVVRHGIFYSTVAFIQKPITPGPLGRKVRDALDSEAGT